MKEERIELVSDEDGLALFGILQMPAGKIKGVVHLVHGMCEHKERYRSFLRVLAEHGYAAVIFDLRGHGESVRKPQDLGYFYDASGRYLINDIHQVVHWMKRRFPDVPYFLFGHSMGSLAVRCYVRRFDYELNGVIVCGSPSYNPLLPFARLFARLQIRLRGDRAYSPFLDKQVLGAYQKRFPRGENAWLSSNETAVAAYNNDALCGFSFTLNGYANLFALLADTYDEDGWLLRNPQLPFLFIAGADDPCIQSVKAWHRAMLRLQHIGYSHVMKVLYPGARHELLQEHCCRQVQRDVLAWLESQL